MRAQNAIRLTREEQAIGRGERGLGTKLVFEQQLAVAEFFGADRFVPITHVHLSADYEVMGEGGGAWLERWLEHGLQVSVPTTRGTQCIPRGAGERFCTSPQMASGEQETRARLQRLGVTLLDTGSVFQGPLVPLFGEHIAWGDSGAVTYANGALGARSNVESGPAALAAAITGRTPAYGFHLDASRAPTLNVHVTAELQDVADWGALGAVVGRRASGYFSVPFFEIDEGAPSSDDMKHLAAALASYGSIAMFHIAGVTPEAERYREIALSIEQSEIIEADLVGFLEATAPAERAVELVVLGPPELSLREMEAVARLFAGRRVNEEVTVFANTSLVQHAAAHATGTLLTLRDAGVLVLAGTNWYNSEIAASREHFAWRRLLTNSAKLANAVHVLGYEPVLAPTHVCVEAAVSGRLP
ncbi:MAG TPA: aconitase X [Candidatus Baltobacteraceae bacterium]